MRIPVLWRTACLSICATGLLAAGSDAQTAQILDQMRFRYEVPSRLAQITDMGQPLIYAEGPIVEGTASRFTAFLSDNDVPSGAAVILNSPGGSVSEALALGSIIRQHNFETSVSSGVPKVGQRPAACFSACTLAFLGGTRRYVAPDALFGVHQLSTTAKLSPEEALKQAQNSIGQITAYVALMGAKAEFVYQLTRATPDQINVLNQQQLLQLNVVTPVYVTDWQIKTVPGGFYLLAATTTNGGLDKMMLACQKHQPFLMFLFNATGKYQDDAIEFDTDFGFEFDNVHMDLIADEILERPKKSGDQYVAVTIALSPRILQKLRATNALTFEMMMPSHYTYQGWTMDFAGGRDKFFSFLGNC